MPPAPRPVTILASLQGPHPRLLAHAGFSACLTQADTCFPWAPCALLPAPITENDIPSPALPSCTTHCPVLKGPVSLAQHAVSAQQVLVGVRDR